MSIGKLATATEWLTHTDGGRKRSSSETVGLRSNSGQFRAPPKVIEVIMTRLNSLVAAGRGRSGRVGSERGGSKRRSSHQAAEGRGTLSTLSQIIKTVDLKPPG